VSVELRNVLAPLLREVESLNERIKEYDERMEKIAKEVYPEVSLLKQVKGVGTQIALTYVLTIEDPYRFPKSRAVGCFLGLQPGRRNSGESEPQKKNQQRRRPLSANDDGARSALHSGAVWRRQ
jgi:transposase